MRTTALKAVRSIRRKPKTESRQERPIGEAFYSQRVYEYAAAIAPRGEKASYGSLAYLSFLVGKLLVGTGGLLLAAFVPEHGPRHPGTMWLIFALAASVALIGLILFRSYIRVPEAGRQE